MNREPERPIEQSLLDYGRSRVEQTAPAELHPATRAMLQAEVARAITKPLAESSDEAMRNFARPFASTPHQPNWLARFWPRLAFGGTVLAAFALVVTVLQNEHTRTKRELDERGAFAGETKSAQGLNAEGLVTRRMVREERENLSTLDGERGTDSLAAAQAGRTSTSARQTADKLNLAMKEDSVAAQGLPPARAAGERGAASVGTVNDRAVKLAAGSPDPLTDEPKTSGALAGGAGLGGFGGGGGRAAGKPAELSLAQASSPDADPANLGRSLAVKDGAKRGVASESAVKARDLDKLTLKREAAPKPQTSGRPDSGAVATPALSVAIAPSSPRSPAPALAPAAQSAQRGSRSAPARDSAPEDAIKSTASESLPRMESKTRASLAAGAAAPGSVPSQPAPTTQLGDVPTANSFVATAALRQHFSQEDSLARIRRNFLSPTRPPVLLSFQLERSGENVVITDADGSTYVGLVTEPPAAEQEWFSREARDAKARTETLEKQKSDGVPAEKARRLGEAESKPAGADTTNMPRFYFRAAGTNRTLSQPVVFTGSFVPMETTAESGKQLGVAVDEADKKLADAKRLKGMFATNEAQVRFSTVGLAAAGSKAPPTPAGGPATVTSFGINRPATNTHWGFQSPQSPPTTRVQGTAVIGKDRLEINATPKK